MFKLLSFFYIYLSSMACYVVINVLQGSLQGAVRFFIPVYLQIYKGIF